MVESASSQDKTISEEGILPDQYQGLLGHRCVCGQSKGVGTIEIVARGWTCLLSPQKAYVLQDKGVSLW